MTKLDVAKTTNPFHGMTGVKNQATAAVPPMNLKTARSVLFALVSTPPLNQDRSVAFQITG